MHSVAEFGCVNNWGVLRNLHRGHYGFVQFIPHVVNAAPLVPL
jgi:hypothetical protein